MSNGLVQHVVGRKPYGIQETFLLKIFVDLGFGKGRVASEIFPPLWLQYLFTMGSSNAFQLSALWTFPGLNMAPSPLKGP
jgi:hypothetical protein